jgi:hypothetical protein
MPEADYRRYCQRCCKGIIKAFLLKEQAFFLLLYAKRQGEAALKSPLPLGDF